jgi:hypothetical protein
MGLKSLKVVGFLNFGIRVKEVAFRTPGMNP